MEATMGRKSSVVEVVSSRCPMNLDKEAAMQHYVGTDPTASVVWSQANVPVSACSIASYDHSLKRSEDSVMSCETGNSSPMVFSHSLEYPEPFHLQKSYPSSTTTSTQSFTVSIESSPHEELHDGFIASNSHTQHTEQISHIYPYSEYMAPDHIVGSMDHQVFNSLNGQPAGGVVSSEQSPLSNWHSKIITGFVHPLGSHTVSWEPQFSVAGSQSTEMNFVDISMVTDESNDQGFHLSHPRKRSSTSDEDEEMYHLAKKTSWPFNSADSKCQKLKPTAKKISATDPQSVAARHRRERISERLKILQELIPNGSKVDLVTMLEKAINYVKFLQLQVRVLTTDEYWPTQDGALPNIDKVKEALQALTSTRASVDTDGTSSSSSELGKKSQSQDKSKSAASHDKSVKKVQNQTQCTSASPC